MLLLQEYGAFIGSQYKPFYGPDVIHEVIKDVVRLVI